MNIILDIDKWDGFWVANHPDAKGFKLGWIGLFWVANDTINQAAIWKKRCEEAENKTIETLKEHIELLILVREAIDSADINVLSERYCCTAEQHVQTPGETEG